jgi:hypothetical protein
MFALLRFFLLAMTLLGCATRPPMLRGQSIKKPIAVLLRVSEEVGETDDLGGTATLVDAVAGGLTDRGLQYQLFTAKDDNPPTPRIEIWVEKWDTGDRAKRAGATFMFGVVGQVATAGGYSVVCKIFRDGEVEPASVFGYSGSIMDTDESASTSNGSAVGNSIVGDAFKSTDATTIGRCLVPHCS